MAEPHFVMSIARIATAALGAIIAGFALRAYVATRRRSLLALGGGAGLLAAGYFLEGVLVEVAGWTIADASVVESVTTLVAAATLVASLYLRDAVPRRSPPPARDGAAPGSPP